MEIRSVTLFVEPEFSPANAAAFFSASRLSIPVPVQTTRVATAPFPDWWPAEGNTTTKAMAISDYWRVAGADYVSLGPVLLHHHADWVNLIPEIIQASETLFASIEIADQTGLMLPVLEDSVLAARSAEGHISISDLFNFAAVCGVGLDTVPLPGGYRSSSSGRYPA